MNIPETNMHGDAFAKTFSLGSRLVSRPRWLQRVITGDNDPDGWTYIDRRAGSIEPWVHFDGDPNGPRLPIPRLYRQAGLLGVQKSEMGYLQATHAQSRQAVAIRFGNAVVVGALADGRSYPHSTEDESLLLATPRISRGDLDVAIGVYLPEERDFVAAATARSLGCLALRES